MSVIIQSGYISKKSKLEHGCRFFSLIPVYINSDCSNPLYLMSLFYWYAFQSMWKKTCSRLWTQKFLYQLPQLQINSIHWPGLVLLKIYLCMPSLYIYKLGVFNFARQIHRLNLARNITMTATASKYLYKVLEFTLVFWIKVKRQKNGLINIVQSRNNFIPVCMDTNKYFERLFLPLV